MTTNADTTQECIAIPPRATVVGVDGDGSTHHLGNRVTAGGIPVYVEHADGSREVYDLTETPCVGHPDYTDPVKAWIAHVRATCGEWDHVGYGKPLAEMAVAEVGD
jgi:hypothetical protein